MFKIKKQVGPVGIVADKVHLQKHPASNPGNGV
jgi:hypothetical protein